MDFEAYAAKMKEKKIDTTLLSVSPQGGDAKVLWPAARALARGELVAFPTETVYGLGASAFLENAVAFIFLAKGRPADNPLIVHVASDQMLEGLVKTITPLAQSLFKAFMPGPLTLVMEKDPRVSAGVTAGLDTVAVRMPAHPVARQLIELAGVPVAAPSANRSGRPSPTRAWHVKSDLWGRVSYIIDAGHSAIGLESTVLDISGKEPTILRPGSISAAQIDAVIRPLGMKCQVAKATPPHAAQPAKAPGMKYRHYAPRAEMTILRQKDLQERRQALLKIVCRAIEEQKKVGIFCSRQTAAKLPAALTLQAVPIQDETPEDYLALAAEAKGERSRQLPVVYYGQMPDVAAASATLFAALRTLDQEQVDLIVAEGLPDLADADAYMNRLLKAAAQEEDAEASFPDRRLLFVCSGNTCRSPMAEALFNARAANRGWVAMSAGVAAMAASGASQEAQTVLKEAHGLDLSGHASLPLTQDLLESADLVLTMTIDQRDYLRDQFPQAKARIRTLHEQAGDAPANVCDPFGKGLAAYRQTAESIARLIDRILAGLSQNDS